MASVLLLSVNAISQDHWRTRATPTTEKEPELTSSTDPVPEPIPTTEPEPAAMSFQDWKTTAKGDKVCEPASTYVPLGVLVELDENDFPPFIPVSPSLFHRPFLSFSSPSQFLLGPSSSLLHQAPLTF